MLVLGNAPVLRDQSGVQVLVVSLELNLLPPVQGILILEVAKQRKVVARLVIQSVHDLNLL